MTATLLRVAWRVLAVIASVALPSYTITFGGQLMAGQNVLDLVAFAFASCLTILNRNRILLFFTSPRIGTSHVFSLGLAKFSIGVCLSAMSAIHWRASGHLASLNDGGVRVIFRVLYCLGLAEMMLASGPYEVNVTLARLRTVLITFAVVAFLISALFFADTLRDYLWPKPTVPDWVLMGRSQ